MCWQLTLRRRSWSRAIRDGEGPQFLHAITYRFKGHVSVDPATYRDGEEVARALENDPIAGFAQQVALLGVKEAELDEFERRSADRSREARCALPRAAPWPDKGGAYTDIQDTGSGRWLG